MSTLFENYQASSINAFSGSELLSAAFRYYMTNNRSLTVPYHNVNHMLAMAHIVNTLVSEEELPESGIKDVSAKDALLLCVIFHDFGHSAGRCTDDVNIADATIAMESFIDRWNMTHQIEVPVEPVSVEGVIGKVKNFIGRISDLVNGRVSQPVQETRTVDHIGADARAHLREVIRATQYPYLYPTTGGMDNACRAIRDADIMVAMNQDYFSQCICGLMAEMNLTDVAQTLDRHYEFIIGKLTSMTYRPFSVAAADHIGDFQSMVDTYKSFFGGNTNACESKTMCVSAPE